MLHTEGGYRAKARRTPVSLDALNGINEQLSSYALARAYGAPATLASVVAGARDVFAELRRRGIQARGARLSTVVALAMRSARDWTDNGRLVWCF